MTNKQREAIEKLEYVNRWYDCNNYYSRYELDCIDTVLSLIKEQEEKIKKYEKIYKEYDCYRWVKELDKKDKQIDLMAEYWNTGLAMCDDCEKIVEKYEKNNCKDCIKQYFERNCKNE